MTEEIRVYDTSALLNRFFFNDVENAYITNSVIAEIKDFAHRQILENKIAKGLLVIKDPSSKYLELARRVAKRTNLSNTDISVLALASELNGILVTDDRTLQGCGIKLGLNVFNVLYSKFDWPNMKNIDHLLERVYKKYAPTEKELKEIKKTGDLIVKTLTDSAKRLKLPVKKILMAGSAARQTHLKNKQDLDIFILFDLNVDENKLEEYNKNIVEVAFPKIKLIKDYGQHPYFKTKLFGYDVEFVPGYDIKCIEEKKSSVDRTPLHLKYLETNLTKDMKREIIITRQFLKNNLLYGAELKYNGVPGYLLELLIINYKNSVNLCRAAIRWEDKVFVDVAKHYTGKPSFNDPLVVIDPTDSERNVAAAFSKRNFEIFKFLCKEFVNSPKESFFNGDIYKGFIDENELGKAIVFELDKTKHRNEDALWGAMKSLSEKVINKLKEKHIKILKHSVLIEKKVYLTYLLDEEKGIHSGPKVDDSINASKFKQKNPKAYVKDGQLFVDINLTKKEKVKAIKEILSERGFESKEILLKDIKLNKENQKILHKDFINLK